MIEIQNLTKRYGDIAVLEKMTLSVPQGVVLGLIGPRGSGKSTLLRVLATLVEPSEGDALINGASVTRDKLRARQAIGFLSDDFGVYPDFTCAEYVEFFAACYGVPPAERTQIANDLLQLVDLTHRKDTPAERMTRGMKQRLGLARVLAHDPQVLLLDELFAPLDPRARVETRELVLELGSMGKTIVLTGASLAEMQDVCTHVVAISEGHIDKLGTLAEVAEKMPPHRTLMVKFLGDTDLATRILQEGRGVVNVLPMVHDEAPAEGLAGIALLKELRVTFDGSYGDASALLRSLMHSGVQIVVFAEQE